MGKIKKPVQSQKKKGKVVVAGDASNGKIKKNKSSVMQKKQQKKKNKKAVDDNSSIESTILTEKNENVIDHNESSGQESKKPSPKKKGKKAKDAVVDETVAGEIPSNTEIVKEEKTIVDTVVQPVSPSKSKKKKNNKKKGVAGSANVVEKVVVEKKPTESDRKRKNSAATDDEEDETEPISDKKPKKSKNTEETDEEVDASPKKQKSKNTKTDDETNDEAAKEKTPSVSVFVGNLPVNTKRDKILKLFSKFGKVKSIRFRLSNGTKFFKSQSKVTSPNVIAFVDYDTVEDAQSSLVMNGEKIKDNVIRVNLQSNAKTADSFDGKRTVFVGNLKYSVNDQTLHDLFSCCGEIEYARTMQCDKGCNGIGYVCFKKNESISMALELNNADLLGRPVRVQRYVKKTPGGPKEKKNKKEKPTGAVRRLGKNQKVKAFNKGKEPSSKKSFAGVKAKEKKKGFVKKTKKPLKGPKLLAKKIASRDKTTKAT